VPTLPQYIIEPIWEQDPRSATTKRKADHPLGCHKLRILDRVIFERLLEILIFGCAYEMPLVRLVVGTDPDDGLGGEAAMDRALLGDLQKL
jgi:hypothetical protein